jgi:hypothetical protein
MTPSKKAKPEATSHWSDSYAKRVEAFAEMAEEMMHPDDEWLKTVASLPGTEVLERMEKEPEQRVTIDPPALTMEDLPDAWTGTAVRLATYRASTEGAHVVCKYTLKMMHEHSALPTFERRKVVPKLPLLERNGRHKATTADQTLWGYLQRECKSMERMSLTEDPVPYMPARFIYCVDKWIAYDYTREVCCATCGKEMHMLNGRTTTKIDKFSFRPCCYPPLEMFRLKPTAHMDVSKIHTLFYDLECTPTEGGGIHEMYMGVVKMPAELALDYDDYGDDGLVRINTPKDLMNLIQACISWCLENPVERGRASIQIVSFNGSRYDDTFVLRAWREFVYQSFGKRALHNLEYSERQGALTFNTLKLNEKLEVRWTDLTRFVPPTSLRNLAKSFKLEEEKGSMPFEALNDFVRRGPEAVKRSVEDGFLDVSYYHGDEKERQASKEYYLQVVEESYRTPSKDIDRMCEKYCAQDVRVTAAAYDTLQHMYSTYLQEQADLSPFIEPGDTFSPMCLHSMSTMAGKIELASAAGSVVWGYDSDTKTEHQVCVAFGEVKAGIPKGQETEDDWRLSAPQGASYDYFRQAVVGGWTRTYLQGLLVDDSATPPDMLEDVTKLELIYDVNAKHNVPHQMDDIASMYPVAVTYAMPVGKPRWVEVPEERERLLAQCIAEPDPLKIPKFFLRASWRAPTKPLFFESTLPQRAESTNRLRWSYWDDTSGTRVVTSLDLWIACHDHLGAGPSSVWTCYDVVDMAYFPHSCQLYRPFMEACTKLKMDGAAENNLLKRTIGKIAMNAGIGKLGQQVEAKHNVMGKEAAFRFSQGCGDTARLVGCTNIELNGGGRYPHIEDVEYMFGVKNPDKNRWPTHHAAFMYAATRLMRLNWSMMTRPPAERHTPIFDMPLPDTFYGDTDSKVLASSHSSLMPKEMQGNLVGQFKPELENGLTSRPFFQIEPESICAAPFVAAITGVMAPKKYFVWGVDPTTGKSALKIKCNGIRRFSEERHPCPLHRVFRCAECVCKHGIYCFECLPCCLALLSHEVRDEDANVVGRGYKYSTHDLPSLTLLDFVRVIVTGQSCKTTSESFLRTLSVGTSKLPPFTIQTAQQARSLNRPTTLKTLAEAAKDRPASGALAPFISGCIERNGILLPTGSYLHGVKPVVGEGST